ncbi:MAG TPA: phosphotransferase family protein [Acidimicrobiales bacterium]|nr:phosphotransferase family protein [Acidimicrobiales bacterium]
MTTEAELVAALSVVLSADVDDLERVTGGASRETWAFSTASEDVRRKLILRRDPPGAMASGLAREAQLLECAAAVGVPVPEVIASGADLAGASFVVMRAIDGETIPRRLLRDDAFSAVRPQLASQCGRILAAVHRMDAEMVDGLPDDDPLERDRLAYDEFGQPHAAFELAFRWLEDHRPATARRTVVHGDFRNGNLIVGPDGIRAVIDWELAHAGDPIEDLGWLCARAWRFGSDKPVGGFGDYDDLIAAYETESGTVVDRDALLWWETMATLTWGVICMAQTESHRSGALRSVELAAIGRRVAEVEWDLLTNLARAGAPGHRVAPSELEPGWDLPAPEKDELGGGLYGVPTAGELVEAAREFLVHDVVPATEGRVRFHARVAANVLAIVGRELASGAAGKTAHSLRLAALGVGDERELCALIHDRALGDVDEAVVASVRADVVARLAVANPRYFGD